MTFIVQYAFLLCVLCCSFSGSLTRYKLVCFQNLNVQCWLQPNEILQNVNKKKTDSMLMYRIMFRVISLVWTIPKSYKDPKFISYNKRLSRHYALLIYITGMKGLYMQDI